MSLSSLKGKYDGFMSPAFKISVGGTEISKCADVAVDQCVGASSGGCRFTVTGFYDKGSRKLTADAQTFQPGKKVTVSMGYGSTLKPVFTGYIAQVTYHFEKETALEVNCLDARALMRQSRSAIIKKDKTAEDIVKEILGKYSPLIASNDVKLSSLVSGNIAVEQDDLDFIISESERRGMVFFIRNDKAFITAPKGEECLSLDWEEYHITHSVSYLNMAFNGIGFDTATMEGYTVREEAKQKGSQTDMTAREFFVRLGHSLPEAAGKSVIKSFAQNAALKAQTGTVSCYGMPEIEVGKMVKLNKTPFESVCGESKFFITAVRHAIEEEFITTFEICLGAG